MNTTNNQTDTLLNSLFAGVTDPANITGVEAMLDKYNLNWKVEKQPLVLPGGGETDFFGIVRMDTQKCFTTCKDSYTPFQNTQLSEMLIRISEKTGYNLHSGGSFNGGAKVYLQLESPNKITQIGANRDTVNGFLTGLNSHDGSTSLKWGETNITVSCRNTFNAALKHLKQSARHTESIHLKVEEAIKTLTGVVMAEQSMFEQFIKLSEIPVTQKAIVSIVKQVTDVDILDTNYRTNKLISKYAINRTEELLVCINKEMNQKGSTMWGLMSGVTNYTSHVMQVPKRDNARLESLYSGSGFAVNNEAYTSILEVSNLN